MTKEDSHVYVCSDASEDHATTAAAPKQIHPITHESPDDRCRSESNTEIIWRLNFVYRRSLGISKLNMSDKSLLQMITSLLDEKARSVKQPSAFA
jgi:hypothetical protein